ncbi:hypothetical protein LY90DRAFT_276475 [Neocallimastix californiae]|uniref:Uncharacterized protein n=1 Tax=Neocallimastix californiae TaxID=1754190 RepID=A0A1Y2D565_9FUNG|nr:hypothetical protein LY90DRAFT_276475 [Neocallimastix californiae]|eukprot:ORY54431.1 hypothetical protein LY90DRAFT_276475 [Neocallimastix californiae]
MDSSFNQNPRKLLYLGKRGIYSTWDKNQSISVNEDGDTIRAAIKRNKTSIKKKTIEQYNDVISPFHEKEKLQPINKAESNNKEGFLIPKSTINTVNTNNNNNNNSNNDNGANQKSSKSKKKDKEQFRTALVKIIM